MREPRSHVQAHLSAEQPTAGKEARISSQDAYSCRTVDRKCTQGQGPPARECLTEVLPRQHRITKSSDFALITRRGRKTKRGCVLIYSHVPAGNATRGSGLPPHDKTARVGLIVSSRVGNSVVRNRVSRVLRHELMGLVPAFHPGAMLVVRALPQAGLKSNRAIASDLKQCLNSLPVEVSAIGHMDPRLGRDHG